MLGASSVVSLRTDDLKYKTQSEHPLSICTYRGGGHAASVSQPFLHPHSRVQEALHAEVSENRLEVLAHLVEGLELPIESLLSFLR